MDMLDDQPSPPVPAHAKLILLDRRPEGLLRRGEAFFVYLPDETLDPSGIIHACPCGCMATGHLWFEGKSRGYGPEWSVIGNWPMVSLTPSIGMRGTSRPGRRRDGFHWHGYLKLGVFEELP
jgi:hypothetical protein